MKKTILTAAIAMTVAGAAFAGQGLYVGGGIGGAHLGVSAAQLPRAVAVDNNDTSFSVFVGKQLNRHYAVEAGYTRLGDFYATTAQSGYLATAQMYSMAGVARLPLYKGAVASAKLGLAHTEVTLRGDTSEAIKPYIALGLEYPLTRKVSAYFEHQHVENFASKDFSANNTYVGLKAHF